MSRMKKLQTSSCCQTGCPDCPFGYSQKLDPQIPQELRDPWERDSLKERKKGEEEEKEICEFDISYLEE